MIIHQNTIKVIGYYYNRLSGNKIFKPTLYLYGILPFNKDWKLFSGVLYLNYRVIETKYELSNIKLNCSLITDYIDIPLVRGGTIDDSDCDIGKEFTVEYVIFIK